MNEQSNTLQNIPGGYIVLARKIRDSWIWTAAPIVLKIFLYLLMKCTHQTITYKGYTLRRGQCFITLNELQDATAYHVGYRLQKPSKPQLTKILRRFKNDRMMETTKAIHGLIITICNYDLYQQQDSYEGNDESKKNDLRRKRQGHNIEQTQYKHIEQGDSIAALEFPVKGSPGPWEITSEKISEYMQTYPAVDVDGELRRARQWLIDNPAKRKTSMGMGRFLNGWLSRAKPTAESAMLETATRDATDEDMKKLQELGLFSEAG